MPKEVLGNLSENFDLVRTLAPQTKMRMLLEIFDVFPDKEVNKKRKEDFIALMGKYYQSGLREKTKDLEVIQNSEQSKKSLHNQIIEIIRNISLSRGLSKEQQQLTEYLFRNRKEVEKMIGTYFLGYSPNDPKEQSELKQAMRGEGQFGSVPGKENE